MSHPQPGLYVGTLRHRRHAPRRHDFAYPVFLALLDIDRLPAAMRVSRLTSYNRWNWASFDERDHFGDPSRPLRERVAQDAAACGLSLPGGPIFLLTHLRYLGYCFNPVSFYYCYDAGGRLQVVLAEVNNTFGETHNYWLSTPDSRGAGTPAGRPAAAVVDRSGAGSPAGPRVLRYRTTKVFHVSPFMPLDTEYDWVMTPPGDHLVVHMATLEQGVRTFDATLSLTHRPWTPREIRRTLGRYPWMTAKVMAAIHYQALRLFLKGVPFYPHPGTPPSIGNPREWKKGTTACAPSPIVSRSAS